MRKIIYVILTFLFGICHCLKAQTFTLNGDAYSLGGDCYGLTKEAKDQISSIWFNQKLNLNYGFDISFSMNFGNLHSGADGMTFALQTESINAEGTLGGSFGWASIKPSFAVEFDTYQNTSVGDPAYNHICFDTNGDVSHTDGTNVGTYVSALASQAYIDDSLDHAIRITWNPVYDSIKVYFDCELRDVAKYDIVNKIFSGNPYVWWGFTGGTGKYYNNQSVCFLANDVVMMRDTSMCVSDTVQFYAPAGSGYTWTPSTSISNTAIADPLFYPSSTTTYYVSYTDLCGNAEEDSVTITITNTPPTTPVIKHTVTWDTLYASPSTYYSYQWYKNNVIIAGKTSDSLVIGTDTSTYNVVVSNSASGCTTSATISQSRVLPIELLSFDASYNGETVNLNWSTASEINNDFFTIERTKDGINFTPVINVKGAGSSTRQLYYSAVDESPLPGISAYRLKQTDYDGKFSYSGLISVYIKTNSRLQILSLMSNQEENAVQYFISFPDHDAVNMEITDRIGKTILSKNLTANTGSINFSQFPHGIYIIRVFDAVGYETKKFVY